VAGEVELGGGSRRYCLAVGVVAGRAEGGAVEDLAAAQVAVAVGLVDLAAGVAAAAGLAEAGR